VLDLCTLLTVSDRLEPVPHVISMRPWGNQEDSAMGLGRKAYKMVDSSVLGTSNGCDYDLRMTNMRPRSQNPRNRNN
jgi:hypothetical protein